MYQILWIWSTLSRHAVVMFRFIGSSEKAIAFISLYRYVPWACQVRVRVHVARGCGSTHLMPDRTTPLLDRDQVVGIDAQTVANLLCDKPIAPPAYHANRRSAFVLPSVY
jgi:hypothetical protein